LHNDSEGPDEITGKVIRSQRNVLPHEIIGHGGRDADEVLWNGPRDNSSIQKAGVLIFGTVFVLAALSLGSILSSQGAVVGLAVPLLFFAAGVRMIYRALWPKRRKE